MQCLSARSTAPAGCTAANVIGNAQSVVISPGGRHAYGAQFVYGISIFDRDPTTGILTQKAGAAGCISDTGKNPGPCAIGRVLSGAYPLSISPDGHTLYVSANNDDGISIFHVNADGSLTQLAGAAGCITLTGHDDTGNPTCAVGRGLDRPYGSTISPDGQHLYVTELPGGQTEGGVAAFSLDPATGDATQLPGSAGCLTVDGASNGTAGACAVDPELAQSYQPIVSPDGRNLYVASYFSESLTALSIETGPNCAPATVTITVGAPLATQSAGQTTTTAPPPAAHVTHATQSHRRWREGKHGGTTFSFTLNQAARVTFTFTQKNHERALGRITIAGHPGRNKLAFNGLINHRLKLKPGTYTVTIAAGASTPQRLTFTIVR